MATQEYDRTTLLPFIIPYLTATVRFRLAQAGSIRLRQLIMSEQFERQALMEYLRIAVAFDVSKTLNDPPFSVTPFNFDLNVLRRRRLRRGLKTWHSVCARSLTFAKPCVDDTWSGTRSAFEELIGKLTLCKAVDMWRPCVEHHVKSKASTRVILLLRSGFPSETLMKLAPIDLIMWSEGQDVLKHLPSVYDTECFIEPHMQGMTSRDFFSWDFACQHGVKGDGAGRFEIPESWMADLFKDFVIPRVQKLNFKPYVDSVHFEQEGTEDEDANLVLFRRDWARNVNCVCLFGNKKIVIR
eukprot:Blabericola_migrator_1__4358@NODE_2342_length_2911_cov_319_686709_g1465_i0_p2_GENE_NODE_2342_length_2911_cov_319_686709_g1465_i0NODE_2342_length_2911_cov_319_686709_g1465_i0_p2_ORF_typecomplete_len298_score58_47_NODE_2342_length_2911_cov_319_686709_g1465_i016552548